MDFGLFDALKDAILAAVQLVIDALGALIGTLISAWPIGMPALPSAPAELGEAFAWVRWSPLPVDAGFAFFLFAVSVWLAWQLLLPALRWTKVIE